MTTAEVLAALRGRLNEIDLYTATMDDDDLLAAIKVARDLFEVRRLSGFDALAVDLDITSVNYGIVPAPTLEQGHLLAIKAAIDLLNQTYRSKLSRGELATSWQSGLESESTISAADKFRDMIKDLERELQEMDLIKRSDKAGYRVT